MAKKQDTTNIIHPDGMTHQEIGKLFGMTAKEIKDIEIKAIKKLKLDKKGFEKLSHYIGKV